MSTLKEIKDVQHNAGGGITRVGDKRKAHRVHGLAWSDAKKLEVATAQAMGLSATQIAAATGVSAETIKHWRKQEWFRDLVNEVQTDDDTQIDGKLTKLIHKSLDAVVDRLENGDYMWDSKRNKFVRRPVYMKDALRATTEVINRRQLLRGKPTSISSKEEASDRLKRLGEQFERFALGREIEGEVIQTDVEVVSDPQGSEV